MKQYYVGLSAMRYFGNYNQLEHICKKYQNYIDTWYTTPPFGKYYDTRRQSLITPTATNFIELKNCIDILKQYNQKIQFTFNTQTLKNLDIDYCKEILDSEIELYGKPDSIVALDYLLPLFSYYDIPLGYSFNNYYQDTKFKNLKYCDTFVVGGSQYIHNISFMQKMKEKYNVKIELLVNNGCHNNCKKECPNCLMYLKQVQDKLNYIDVLASYILFPRELDFFPIGLIDYYKVSSRPAPFEWLNRTLEFYTQHISIYDIMKDIDLTKSDNWTYFCRSQAVIDYLKQFEPIDVNAVIDKKIESDDRLNGKL